MAQSQSDPEPSDMTDDELLAKYNEIVEDGANRGARGMSIGPAVMKAGPYKREMQKRGIWKDR